MSNNEFRRKVSIRRRRIRLWRIRHSRFDIRYSAVLFRTIWIIKANLISGNNLISDIESTTINKSVGLNLNFNLFNGFRDKINYQNSWLEAKNQELNYNKTLNQLNGLVHEKYTSLNKQIEITKLEEENVIAAQQNLQLLQDLFQVGAASSLEFRDAQVNLAKSQANLIASKFQAKILQLELDQLTGILSIE